MELSISNFNEINNSIKSDAKWRNRPVPIDNNATAKIPGFKIINYQSWLIQNIPNKWPQWRRLAVTIPRIWRKKLCEKMAKFTAIGHFLGGENNKFERGKSREQPAPISTSARPPPPPFCPFLWQISPQPPDTILPTNIHLWWGSQLLFFGQIRSTRINLSNTSETIHWGTRRCHEVHATKQTDLPTLPNGQGRRDAKLRPVPACANQSAGEPTPAPIRTALLRALTSSGRIVNQQSSSGQNWSCSSAFKLISVSYCCVSLLFGHWFNWFKRIFI